MNLKSTLSLILPVLLLSACGNRSEDSGPIPPPQTPAPPTSSAYPEPAPYVGQRGVTPTGIQWEVLKVGTGARPKSFNEVKVHYHGYFPNGTVFDSSIQRGEPIVFPLNGVIPGWTEGVQLMQEGAQYRFLIPWLQAYGLNGSPPKIGPKQDLMFDIELIQIVR